MLEKMQDFFANRIAGYDAHMLTSIDGVKNFYQNFLVLQERPDGTAGGGHLRREPKYGQPLLRSLGQGDFEREHPRGACAESAVAEYSMRNGVFASAEASLYTLSLPQRASKKKHENPRVSLCETR